MGGRTRTVVTTASAFALLVLLWELVKLVVPDDGVVVGGVRILPRTDDASMPHVWTVLAKLGQPEVAGAADARTVGAAVAQSALYTLGLALGGLVLGGVLGMVLALVMLRFRLAERAMLPYIVASQTVPLIAIAPLVAGWGGKIAIMGWAWQPWASVMVIASYLAFFPIAVGALRGLAGPGRASSSCSRRWPRAGGPRCCGCGCPPRCPRSSRRSGWPRRPRWSARSSPRSRRARGAASAG